MKYLLRQSLSHMDCFVRYPSNSADDVSYAMPVCGSMNGGLVIRLILMSHATLHFGQREFVPALLSPCHTSSLDAGVGNTRSARMGPIKFRRDLRHSLGAGDLS
mmetsp:Transcript_28573/g.64012  ORF Transcript_28573/g.64012 Transcript_28573/m.64012 type:complete len:104 (+) Transcript_28573:494-805(+)